MKYIIKISPELTIKSKPVRKRAILMLKNNISKHLRYNDIKFQISGNWDLIQVISGSELIPKILKQVPGIAHFMEVESFLLPLEENEIFDFVFEKTKEFYLDKIMNKTFVVRINRAGNHNFRSIDLEKYVGGGLLQSSINAKVQLKNADITVRINIKDKKVYIIKNTIIGIGGYPVGFQDRVISLISGGFDSGVSTYSMMKRGCLVDYLFFNLGGNEHEKGVKEVSKYLWEKFSIPHKKARFISVNFENVIKELLTKTNHKYRGILLKRFMLKIACMISENHYYAIIKGDSLGQVSSQTLKNMFVIDKASSELVLRPLIGFNKQEIIDITKEIGTYDFACGMPEYCGVISNKPSTGAKLENVLEEEEKFDFTLLETAFLNRKTEFINDTSFNSIKFETKKLEDVFEAGKNDIIIDLREKLDIELLPLNLKVNKIIEIPFYEINEKFPLLDQSKNYLFYCEKGILSNIHGLYLKEQGFTNISKFNIEK